MSAVKRAILQTHTKKLISSDIKTRDESLGFDDDPSIIAHSDYNKPLILHI